MSTLITQCRQLKVVNYPRNYDFSVFVSNNNYNYNNYHFCFCLISLFFSKDHFRLWLERYHKAYPIPNTIGLQRYQYPIPILIPSMTSSEQHISVTKGGSRGSGGMPPPVVSVCNIFCAWLLAFRHTTQFTSKRFLNRIAEGVGITPPLPNRNLGSATLQLQV